MATGIRFTSRMEPPFRDVQGRFVRADRQLLEDQRDGARTLGRSFKEYAQDEAPKRTGEFAQGISFRTFIKGNTTGFNLYVPEPLSTFIREGTPPHPIVGDPILAFFWEKTGTMMFRHYVSHPGTKPDDYLQRAYDRWQPEAEGTLRRMALRYVNTLT